MSTLEIFGICFIVEIAFIVIALVLGLIVGKIDKINKENTYKHMMKFEEKLKNEKLNKNSQEEDENKEGITEIGLFIPKGTTNTKIQKILNLSDDEFKRIIFKNASILNYITYYENIKEIISKNTTVSNNIEWKLKNISKTNIVSISNSLNIQYNLGTKEKPVFVAKTYDPIISVNLKTGIIKVDRNDDVDIHLVLSCDSSSINEDESEPIENFDQNKLNDLLENAIQK